MPFHTVAQQMIRQALNAIDPFRLIEKQVAVKGPVCRLPQLEVDLNTYERIIVIGFGKAAAPMAAAMEAKLGTQISAGVIVTKYGYGRPLQRIQLFEAGHPLPDANSLKATGHILDVCQNMTEKDLVFVLISGGGSALFERLPQEVSLDDLQQFSQQLLQSGAAIEEINTLRKHISLVKGGQLARLLAPATVISLILSDVIGDPLESIASGPTAPDPSTFADAQAIIKKYYLQQKVPQSISKILSDGVDGKKTETPKPGDALFNKVHHVILGNNRLALRELAEVAQKNGFNPLILTDRLQGEAREVARMIAAIIESAMVNGTPLDSPGCLILGGEPTVTIHGTGKGGRNQELVLSVMLALSKLSKPYYFCSVGTDGTDGPTDAAGAWIDQNSWKKAQKSGLDARRFLEANDSYHLFRKMDQLLITGPTGTNVMDVMFCLF